MFFDDKKQETRLEHILSKYAKLANSNPQALLSLLPNKEYWRFFVDGARHQSARGIRKSFIKAHGEAALMDETFLSMTLNDYNDKHEPLFLLDGETVNINQLLTDKLWLTNKEYKKFVICNLRSGEATIRDILQLDQAWVAFEINEPHYLSSVLIAFLNIRHSNETLSVEFVRKAHALLGSTVKGTNYDNSYDEKPGKFRKTQLYAYGLTPVNTSSSGIAEMLNRKNKSHAFIFTINIDLSYRRYRVTINQNSIHNYLNNRDFSAIVSVDENGNPSSRNLDLENSMLDITMILLFRLICEAKTSDKISKLIYSLITESFDFASLYPLVSIRQVSCEMRYAYLVPTFHTRQFYEQTLQKLIVEYLINIERANLQLDKLRIIVTFTQQCEQLHPFYDMNCRLFCMVLLNHLLAQNGFPYAIQADPNRFDMYSIDELIDDILTGMKKTFELIENKAVNNIDTQVVLDALKSSSAHQATFYAEFNKTLEMIDNTMNAQKLQLHSTPTYYN